MPEKEFYVNEHKIYEGRADEVPYAFLAEALEDEEHRGLLKRCFQKLTREEWRSIVLQTANISAVEEAATELTNQPFDMILKDALIVSRRQ